VNLIRPFSLPARQDSPENLTAVALEQGLNSMEYPTWNPGHSGLIYLPDPRTSAAQKNRPNFILEVDEGGRCIIIEGPMRWIRVNARIEDLALEKSVAAFSAPLEKNLRMHQSQDCLVLDP
jgi:hypothetical protein